MQQLLTVLVFVVQQDLFLLVELLNQEKQPVGFLLVLVLVLQI